MVVVGMRDDKGIKAYDAMPPQCLAKHCVLVARIDEHGPLPASNQNRIALPNVERDDLAALLQQWYVYQREHE